MALDRGHKCLIVAVVVLAVCSSFLVWLCITTRMNQPVDSAHVVSQTTHYDVQTCTNDGPEDNAGAQTGRQPPMVGCATCSDCLLHLTSCGVQLTRFTTPIVCGAICLWHTTYKHPCVVLTYCGHMLSWCSVRGTRHSCQLFFAHRLGTDRFCSRHVRTWAAHSIVFDTGRLSRTTESRDPAGGFDRPGQARIGRFIFKITVFVRYCLPAFLFSGSRRKLSTFNELVPCKQQCLYPSLSSYLAI